VAWTPPPRAPWVNKLVAYGRGLGDDGRSLISLRPDDLLDAARAATGLDDAGDDWFREPLERLCASLDEEAELHLAGRLRARAELQVILQNRLRLVDLWKKEPGIAGVEVRGPIIVTGMGRSGTTLLHELLSCDPANRPPLLWELLHTVPGALATGDDTKRADWVSIADDEIKLMDDMIPAFTSMHENAGGLPTECIFLFAHQFSSDIFTGIYNVPSYTIWKSGLDQGPAYDWHRRMLQTLQWAPPPDKAGAERWVVKAPSHLGNLPLVFSTYPDARVVMNHRDPLRVVGSLADTVATLHWMHSDRAAYDTLIEFMCMGVEIQMNSVTEARDSGTVPADQFVDVVYRDLVADPIGTIERLYDHWGLEQTAAARARMEAYVAARHDQREAPDRAVRGQHKRVLPVRARKAANPEVGEELLGVEHPMQDQTKLKRVYHREQNPLPLAGDHHRGHIVGQVAAILDEPLHASLETGELVHQARLERLHREQRNQPHNRADLQRHMAAIGHMEHVVVKAVRGVPHGGAIVAKMVDGIGDVEEVLPEFAGHVLEGGVLACQLQRDRHQVEAVHGHPACAIGLLHGLAAGERLTAVNTPILSRPRNPP